MPIISPYNKTRIAPTPSGFLHMGNVLSFAITAALARKNKAKILLRIDDLDRARVNKQYVQDIFDTLNFLEIPWDEGPRNEKEFEDVWSQLHRLNMYNEALRQLADEGKVFACTCSRSQIQNAHACNCASLQIPLGTNNVSWRLHTADSHKLMVKSHSGHIIPSVLPVDMRNFVVKKRAGFPAYQLTSLIDDDFYGVDLIVRGEDLLSSTLAQQLLAHAIGKDKFQDIAFYHHPLLTEASGKKLSKSAGSTSVKYLRETGKKSADVYQLIASMLDIKEAIRSWEQLTGKLNASI